MDPNVSSSFFVLAKLNICVCTLLHGQMYPQKKNAGFAIWARVDTKLLNLTHHFLSMDGWLGDATFFLWGQPLKIIRMHSTKKRSSPLEFIFDTCASASSSHLFWLVKLNICGCRFFQGQMYVQQKNMCFAFWALVDTKFLNLFHHFLSMDGWPGDATFFLWGQPLKIIRMYSAKKRSSPLEFIFDTCASASSSHLLGW